MGWHLAEASPNFALIKYWGKRPGPHNVPAVESISATVDSLQTRVALRLQPAAAGHSLRIDGQPAGAAAAARFGRFVQLFAQLAGGAAEGAGVEAVTRSNFPLAAGLASSASSFAALTLALDQVFGLNLPPHRLADLARQGSGSAARSMADGLVHLRLVADADLPTCLEPLISTSPLPLEVVIAITSLQPKQIGSTEGMERSRLTSPYYAAWVDGQPADIAEAKQAIAAGDFAALAAVSEHSCLKMHGLAQSARPPLIYASAATWGAIACIQQLRQAGWPVFFTVDAGPQLKAFCLPDAAAHLTRTLGALPGVQQVMRARLGRAARRLPAPATDPLLW